jgi:epoxide hydrolase 4
VKTTALRYGLLASLLATLSALGHEPTLEHRFADVNGVRLHFVSAGAGKLIVFLHGFPHFWYQWHPQLAEFSKDHHVVAPDMRGYNWSSKPPAVEQYRIEYLSRTRKI